jgi:hypothetical protein
MLSIIAAGSGLALQGGGGGNVLEGVSTLLFSLLTNSST